MALTKISRGLLNTGVSDSSDATAITITSDEKVLIGSANTTNNLRLQESFAIVSTGNLGGMSITGYPSSIASYRPLIDIQRSRGSTDQSMTKVESGDYLGSIVFRGSDGTNFIDGAEISARADGTTGTNDMPCNLTFHTQPDGGSGASSERMRIDSSGRLLVGVTTHPSVGGVSSSHFTESSSSTNWIQSFRNSQSTPFGISIKYTASPNDSGKSFLYCEDGAPAARFEVRSDGGLKNYSANDVNLSDEREKKNIVDADNQLENIKNLFIKSFHYNEDDDSADKRLGVIAQEVETNLPHLVDEYSNVSGEERKGVKEQQIMWMAIKAIQELSTKLEAAEARITTLEG